ncbi:MAG: hypothetical protein ACK41G_07005 [Candidatus Thermochlorobacter sp.]
MTLTFAYSKLLTLVLAAAFFVYTTVGCQHTIILNDALEHRMALSAPSTRPAHPVSNFSVLSDSAQTSAPAQSDDMRAPNRTGLTILAIGAVVLIVATPIILSSILSSGSRPQGGNDDKTGISAASTAKGH